MSSSDVCQQAGVSFRQLDYWSRIGLLVEERQSKGSGVPRSFRPSEVPVARYLAVTVDRFRGESRVGEIAQLVRDGQRGVVEITHGVLLDLDVICGES